MEPWIVVLCQDSVQIKDPGIFNKANSQRVLSSKTAWHLIAWQFPGVKPNPLIPSSLSCSFLPLPLFVLPLKLWTLLINQVLPVQDFRNPQHHSLLFASSWTSPLGFVGMCSLSNPVSNKIKGVTVFTKSQSTCVSPCLKCHSLLWNNCSQSKSARWGYTLKTL